MYFIVDEFKLMTREHISNVVLIKYKIEFYMVGTQKLRERFRPGLKLLKMTLWREEGLELGRFVWGRYRRMGILKV